MIDRRKSVVAGLTQSFVIGLWLKVDIAYC
jgi:hypothetical protein